MITNSLGARRPWTSETTVLGLGSKKAFNPATLFKNGEQGFWLDPSDLSTMFQDSAGTIPVTGAGQPVGLMLDKSKGMVLGSELITTLDLTTWTTVNSPEVTKNTFTTAATGGVKLDGVLQNGTWYKCVVELDSTVGVQLYGGQQVVTFPGTGRRTITLYYEASAAGFYFRNTSAGTTTIHSLSIESIAGNHAYQTTSASRPILRQNAVTGAYYLEFDGTDDFLQTSNIDFTATDKVSLFTGLRKLRDSPAESILELGVLPYDGVGTFWLTANALAPGDVWLAIAQAWNARTGFSKVTPVANNFIFSAKLDFAGSVATDEVKPRLNGSTAGFTRGLGEHAGTGNFGNHPMYIGSRTGTSLQFNGHLYSLIGVGRLVTDAETKALEKELAKRTGVTLNV